MKIMMTGATGYVGQATKAALEAEGHTVIVVARPDRGTEGALAIDLADTDALTAAAATMDGVVHAAASDAPHFAPVHAAATRALLAGLRPGAGFVMQGGSAVFGPTGQAPAADPAFAPPPPLAGRAALEQDVLDAARGVRASVVYGSFLYGGAGGTLPTIMARTARAAGKVVIPGTGGQVWSAAHVEDFGALMARAVVDASGGQPLFAAADHISMNDIGAELGTALGLPVDFVSVEQATGAYGMFASILAMSQSFSAPGAATRWHPHHRIADGAMREAFAAIVSAGPSA